VKLIPKAGFQKKGHVMKFKHTIFVLACLIVMVLFTHSLAEVEWGVKKTLKIDEAPIDVSVSVKGRWTFVLTDQGHILIYSADGALEDKITVGTHVDGIKAGSTDDMLLLMSRKNKTVQVIALDFIENIDVSGSPFKGPTDAPVVIAVFNDFQ
jgi:hypothetical protein